MLIPRVHRVTLHRSPLRGVEAVTILSNHEFPRHSHDEFGLGLIRRGGHLSWSGIGHVRAGPGDIIMVNPGEVHDGKPLANEPREWSMIYFDRKLLGSELEGEANHAFEVVNPVARDPLLADQFAKLFLRLTSAGAEPVSYEQNLAQVLMRVVQNHSSLRQARDEPAVSIARAMDRIDAAPQIPASLRELATICGISRFQLLRGFRKAFGITPHAYGVQRRVRMAKSLLAGGVEPVYAATLSGFADQSHMTRAFVRQFGFTPARYQAAITSI